MSYPVWPATSMNFSGNSAGVECTMRTSYDNVNLSASETGDTPDKAEKAARLALSRAVAQRKSFE